MILYRNSDNGLPNFINNRFVFHEAGPEVSLDAPKGLNDKEMKEADNLSEKKMLWGYRLNVKDEVRKKIEKNPWTEKDEKRYNKLLDKMTDQQKTEHYKTVNKRSDEYLKSGNIDQGDVTEFRPEETSPQQLEAERLAAEAKQRARESQEAVNEAHRKEGREEMNALTGDPSEEHGKNKLDEVLNPENKLGKAVERAQEVTKYLATADETKIMNLADDVKKTAGSIAEGKSDPSVLTKLFGNLADRMEVTSGSSKEVIAAKIAKVLKPMIKPEFQPKFIQRIQS